LRSDRNPVAILLHQLCANQVRHARRGFRGDAQLALKLFSRDAAGDLAEELLDMETRAATTFAGYKIFVTADRVIR